MKKYFVHKTSIIDKKSKIGVNTKIWHWCHISKNSEIGKNCILGQNVFVGENVKIGNNVKIQNNVSIYNGVILEDEVFCGPSVVFTNVKFPRSSIDKKNQFLKTTVKSGASIGANSTIICGITISKFAIVGAGTIVNKNIKSFSCVYGNPAKHKHWVSRYGDKLTFKKGRSICKHTGEIYEFKKNKVDIA